MSERKGSSPESPRILVVNAGSESVKLSVIDGTDRLVAEKHLGPPDTLFAEQLKEFLDEVGVIDIVGHRVVHGGSMFTTATEITPKVRDELNQLNSLAPLHNPPALVAIDAIQNLLSKVRQIACFDTGFHVGLLPRAFTYAIPAEWNLRWGIRKYGFHGLSCAWSLNRAAQILGRPREKLRLVVCHLGGGASATAISDGKSVDTTMGFTPVEGLVMATRSGDFDPGALLWVLTQGLSVEEVSLAIEHRSGLLGLSGGGSDDMKKLLDARAIGDERAALAIEVYLHRLRAKVAAMIAAIEGIDALVFTGGVGENSAVIRAEATDGMRWLGVKVDNQKNKSVMDDDADISTLGASVRTLVVHSREDLQIAKECRQLLLM